MKKKILSYTPILWMIFVAYTIAPKDHSGWKFGIGFPALTLVLWFLHWIWLRMFLNEYTLVWAQESLDEGSLYVAQYSPFKNRNGLVLKLTRVKKKQGHYETVSFLDQYSYYIHTFDPEISVRMGKDGGFIVKLDKGKLVLSE